MPKKARHAFTLIEVMVAVMIISVVILALLEMFANNTHIFSQLSKQKNIHQYASLFIANSEYGLETKKVTLESVASDFKVQSTLQKELKAREVQILYQTIEQIDLSKYETKEISKTEEEVPEVQTRVIFEIGKTIIKTEAASTAFLRVRIAE